VLRTHKLASNVWNGSRRGLDFLSPARKRFVIPMEAGCGNDAAGQELRNPPTAVVGFLDFETYLFVDWI
jgi:hypothetical protein